MTKMKALIYTTLMGLILTMTACLHDTEASGGISRAEFDALKAEVADLALAVASIEPFDPSELEARVAALEARKAGDAVTLTQPVGMYRSRHSDSHSDEPQQVGTLVALSGGDQPRTATTATMLSPSGYMVELLPGGTDTTALQLYPLTFSGSGCTGQAITAQISDYAAAQGFVFRTGNLPETAEYWMVPSGSLRLSTTPYLSRRVNGGGCEEVSGTVRGFAAQPNDPLLTGIPSGAYEGKLTVGPTG